ncbi:MAG TPA: hypothetical protein VF006_29430 [Longimicrobium sp.]
MRNLVSMLPRVGPVAAMLLAVATPAALAGQAIGVGLGFGVGTRTGASLSIGAQLTDQVQLLCKAGGFPFIPGSISCGAHLYVLDDPDRFVVAEVGILHQPSHHPRDGRDEDVRWVFVQGGLGVRDHQIPDQDGDGLPEYPRWVNGSYSGGLSLVVARIGRGVTPADEGPEPGERQVRPALWPLFFADVQVEIYLPGRSCSGCGGVPSQD